MKRIRPAFLMQNKYHSLPFSAVQAAGVEIMVMPDGIMMRQHAQTWKGPIPHQALWLLLTNYQPEPIKRTLKGLVSLTERRGKNHKRGKHNGTRNIHSSKSRPPAR